ncbi:MAG: ABC transporter permease [Cyclobacteriaceae bacterium]
MLFNYLKTSLRSLLKHRLLTTINLVGLIVGITASMIIAVYAHHILTFDLFHARADQVYMVYKERVTPNGVQPTYDTWIPLRRQLQMDYPQIGAATRLAPLDGSVIVDNEVFEEGFQFVDPSFFEIFDFPLIHGNTEAPFSDPNSVVLSKELAIRLFGQENAVGERLSIRESFLEFEKDYIVTGILEDYPSNTSVEPSMVFPIESIPDFQNYADYWDGSFLFTYILLPEKGDRGQLEAAFPALVEKIWDERTRNNTNLKLLPLAEVYDTMVGDVDNAYLMSYIGLALLVIAVFNFMNLSTAKAIDRAKEIGVRKVLGAFTSSIRVQFLIETIVVTVIATMVSAGLVVLLLQPINELLEMEMSLTLIPSLHLAVGTVVFALLLGILAASYPAFYLSNIKLNELVKSKKGGQSASKARNAMVVLQFAISTTMIIATLGINRQIGFMVNTSMGFDKERIVLNASVADFETEEIGETRIKAFKDHIRNTAGVSDMTVSRHIPAQWTRSFLFARPQGWEGDPMRMRYTYMDAQFFDAFEIPLLEGDGFLPDHNGHQRETVIVNEAALAAFGWEDIQDKVVMIGNNQLRVVGLVKDFNFESLREEVAPTLMMHRTADHAVHQYISFKTPLSSSAKILAQLEEQWSSLGAQTALEYNFLDDQVARLYQDEMRLLSLTKWFTILAVFIAALGLYGLSIFVIERKRREICIRKVMGASLVELWLLITKKFVALYLIAFLVGATGAYFFLTQWLENFAFRSNISVGVFIVALLAMLAMIVTTISYKTIHAGRVNPVTYLRDE